MEPQLIIFDCDGVLVDSEILAAEVESQLLTQSGYPIEPEAIAERFAGLTWTDILLQVEKESGIPISASLIEESARQMDHKLRNELNVIEGAEQVIAALKYPKCVASNSISSSLKMMLEQSTLYDLFVPHIFSAREVGTQKPKPDPNVFLFAAKQFNVDPLRAIVIEELEPWCPRGKNRRHAGRWLYRRRPYLSRPCRQADRCGCGNGHKPTPRPAGRSGSHGRLV